ncbi:MAG TPA: hypothetical protein VHB20_13125 [Verrucomicrobiae bacterium]|jgi:hypothetical protein|nr:hypothetical protein [Verrucomicrobiae bacterium]
MSIAEAVIEKLSVLPVEKQAEVLRFVETVSLEAMKSPPDADPYEWLTVASNLNLDGPADWSEKFEEYLHGGGIGPGQ